ncbi:hypothetical protein ACFLZX_04180 [Nanoarchaeota archaeon]
MENEHIRAKIIIEVVGKPKEHVDKAINSYVEKIKTDADFVLLNTKFAEITEQGKLFSTYVELEIVIKGITSLIGFCFDYMPSSVDIVKPESLAISNRELNAVINDLQAKLHNVDMVAKSRAVENDILKRNLKTMIQNMILVVLVKRELTLDELSNVVKMGSDDLKPFIEELEKNNKIKKEGEKYILAHGTQEKN